MASRNHTKESQSIPDPDRHKHLLCGADPVLIEPKECIIENPDAVQACRNCLPKPNLVTITRKHDL